jgi:hypothetical protein
LLISHASQAPAAAAAAGGDVHSAALLSHACIPKLRPALDADHSCGFLRMVRLTPGAPRCSARLRNGLAWLGLALLEKPERGRNG